MGYKPSVKNNENIFYIIWYRLQSIIVGSVIIWCLATTGARRTNKPWALALLQAGASASDPLTPWESDKHEIEWH